MLGSRACIGIITVLIVIMLAPAALSASARTDEVGGCQTASIARGARSGCYLLAEVIVRGSRKRHSETVIPNVAPTLPVPDTRPNDPAKDQERNRSNQLTILGWIACVYLFAKGLEFAVNPAFIRRDVDGTGQIRPIAAFAAAGICIAAVVLFVLLTLQARQPSASTKDYSNLSDCLRDAQTADQIAYCGSRTYDRPSTSGS